MIYAIRKDGLGWRSISSPNDVGADEYWGDAPLSPSVALGKPDWRGHTYWLADGTQHTITEIGVEPPADAYPSAPPPLETVKAQALAQVRAHRERVFARLAGIQAEALALGDSATAQAIASVQQMLRDLPATDLTACQSEADIKATLEHAWELVAEAAAACAHTAFKL